MAALARRVATGLSLGREDEGVGHVEQVLLMSADPDTSPETRKAVILELEEGTQWTPEMVVGLLVSPNEQSRVFGGARAVHVVQYGQPEEIQRMTEIGLDLARRVKGWAAGSEDIERMGRLLAMCHVAASVDRNWFIDRIKSELDTEHNDYTSLVFVEACYWIRNGGRFRSGEMPLLHDYGLIHHNPTATRLVQRGWDTDACIALCRHSGDPCFHEPYITAVHNRWKRDGHLPVDCLRPGSYNGIQPHMRAMLIEMMPYTLYMVNDHFKLASEAEADAVLAHADIGGDASLKAVQILLWSKFDVHAHAAVMGLLALAPQDVESYTEKPDIDWRSVGYEDGAHLARGIAYYAAQQKPEWAAEIVHYAPNTIHSVVSALHNRTGILINVLDGCTSALPLYVKALLFVARRYKNDAASEHATKSLVSLLACPPDYGDDAIVAKAILDNGHLWNNRPIAYATEAIQEHEAAVPWRHLRPAYKMLLTYEDADERDLSYRRGQGRYLPNREYEEQCVRAYLDDPDTLALLFGIPGTQIDRDIYAFAVETRFYGVEDLRRLVQAMHENPPVNEDDLEWRNDVLRRVRLSVLTGSGLAKDPVLFPPQEQLDAELGAAFHTAEVQLAAGEFDGTAELGEAQRTLVRIMTYFTRQWHLYHPEWIYHWARLLGTYPPVAHLAFSLVLRVATCPDQISVAVAHALEVLATIRPGREALLVSQLASACESVRHGPAVRADICRIAKLSPDSLAGPQVTRDHLSYLLRHLIGSVPQREQ
jgi:hypothetical protein